MRHYIEETRHQKINQRNFKKGVESFVKRCYCKGVARKTRSFHEFDTILTIRKGEIKMTNYQKSNIEIELLNIVEAHVEADKLGLTYEEYKSIQEQTEATKIIEAHTKSCLEFWMKEGVSSMEVLKNTKRDLAQISGNPFTPDGGEERLKQYFIDARDEIIATYFTKYGI